MTTHKHDVLMRINSRIINGRAGGAKQLNADYRVLVRARDEILALRAKLAEQPDRQALQAAGTHPAPCARHCEAQAFEIAARGMRRQIAELQAALAEQPAPAAQQEDMAEQNDWHPIATAPKDGTKVNLKNISTGLSDIGYWHDYRGQSTTGIDGEWSQDIGNGDMTHWRALGPRPTFSTKENQS